MWTESLCHVQAREKTYTGQREAEWLLHTSLVVYQDVFVARLGGRLVLDKVALLLQAVNSGLEVCEVALNRP
jgi:hypothetical protein